MILKAFKEKSNQKFINSVLSKREALADAKPIKTVAVLFNADEYSNYDEFSETLKGLNIQEKNQTFFTFSETETTTHNSWDNVFTKKDFGWKGKLNNNDLQNFTNTRFDVLICYFLAEHTELKQIAAMSKADFKIGISDDDERLYDLMIAVTPNQFQDFKVELKKYLTILNKI